MKAFWALIICIVTISCFEAQACYVARQTRTLPLGVVGKEILALNLVMVRGHEIPDTAKIQTDDPWWHGTARLVLFNAENFAISSTLNSIPVSWSEPNEQAALEHLYGKILEKANLLNGFKPFTPSQISFCNFRQNCSMASITHNGDSTKAFVKYQITGGLYDISQVSLHDSSTVVYYVGAEGPDKYFPEELWDCDHVDIGSTRTFSIGNRTLLLINLNTGQKFELEDGTLEPMPAEYRPAYPLFDRLEHCSYVEPLLHHGTSVDIPIWLD